MSVKPKSLLCAGKIGAMELKNRLVIPAMCTNYTFQGHFTDQAVHYYGLRAKGGAGLMIIEGAAIDYPGARSVINSAISDDRYISTLRRLAEEVHRHGAKIALQIMHSGRQTSSTICGSQPISCSAAASTQILYDPPREITLYECKNIIKRVGETCRNDFAEVLKDQGREVYTVGDGHRVGNAMTAIKSAYDEAIRI